jgi:hypothetical protein
MKVDVYNPNCFLGFFAFDCNPDFKKELAFGKTGWMVLGMRYASASTGWGLGCMVFDH